MPRRQRRCYVEVEVETRRPEFHQRAEGSGSVGRLKGLVVRRHRWQAGADDSVVQ